MKWLPGDSPYWQYAAEDPRLTIVKWMAAGNAGGVDKYLATYKPSAESQVQALSDFTTDVNVARKAAQDHYSAMQRKAA